MSLPRRRCLQLAAGAAVLPVVSRMARAQAYPVRPVRLIVSFAPGGAPDILARLLGHWLSEHLGQPFVIENRPGAGGNIGTEAVVRAAPDGHTLLMVAPSSAINATLYDRLSFKFVRDIAPVASIIRQPFVLLVHPSVPAMTVPELIAYAKANPGKLSMASAGIGTGPHLAGELFKMLAGVDMLHVPYRGGGPAFNGLLAGQVQVMFAGTTVSIEHVKAGRLRALAVTTATRSGELPDVPAIAEFVPGYEASQWFGIGAPHDTPANVVNRLNQAINTGLADARIKARLADWGSTPLAGSPDDFAKLVALETDKWAHVIRFAGIKPQ